MEEVALVSARSQPNERTPGRDLLTIRTVYDGDRGVMKLFGELDVTTVVVLDTELHRIEAESPAGVVLDLSGLEFIDSLGIACLLAAGRRAAEHGRELVMARPRPEVDRVLRLTGVDDLLAYAD